VRADPTRLQQVIWNLLTNAVKFTPDGGTVNVTLRQLGMTAEVSVSDTGVGISAEFLPFVFEPFRQGESRFDRAHGGLGLGLAITKQLVELHGGTIRASSAGIGCGATFTIVLTCVAGHGTSSDARWRPRANGVPSETSHGSLRGVKVLVVDDEEDALAMIQDALEGTGADIRTALTGPSALQIADAWAPDLLVTDLGLPGMDGYALLAAVRRTSEACRAVAVSGYARLSDRSRVLAAGFQAHIAKPVDPADLVAVLHSALTPGDST
jgi:CheY-like chemotaxis protein